MPKLTPKQKQLYVIGTDKRLDELLRQRLVAEKERIAARLFMKVGEGDITELTGNG